MVNERLVLTGNSDLQYYVSSSPWLSKGYKPMLGCIHTFPSLIFTHFFAQEILSMVEAVKKTSGR